MSGISAVIARARGGGGYSERKRFTIARGRAIEKMRRFALADPYYYILELMQAAVANEAGYIEINIEDGDVTLAYVGGGLRKDDLSNLFDYLFASKDRADIGHLRELALGINAALLFKPSRVIVESGDGTLEGTTRLEMHGSHDAVDIGTPDKPLAGTYVRLEGMNRKNLPGVFSRMLFGESRPREFSVIESRCLAAPVPIILNGEALFGFSAQRTPALLGYRRVLSFDEGDLYGTIAVHDEGTSEFDLLMWGVLIASKERRLLSNAQVSGIICFDRLRKTADHSGIVEDEVLDEMFARMMPYVDQCQRGSRKGAFSALRQLDGMVVPIMDMRAIVQETPTMLFVPSDTPPELRSAARAVSAELGAPVFCGEHSFIPSLRAMSGGKLEVVALDPRNEEDVSFYMQPIAEPPARPWLTPVIDVEPLPTWMVMARLFAVPGEEERVREAGRNYAHLLGTGAEVTASVFTPDSTRSADALTVELVTTGRMIWSGTLPSSYPGHVLRIELPHAVPSVLLEPRGGAEVPLGVEIAQIMAQHAGAVLAQAFGRAVTGLADRDVQPGTGAASLALRAAGRTCVPRLTTRVDGSPGITLEQLDVPLVDLCGLPVVRTLDGRDCTLRDVVAMMDACEGLLYGVVEGVDANLAGLDQSRILRLDVDAESSLIELFGESAYVRIDQRDVLAASGNATCRDLAVGLRPYADHPLLVDGADAATEEAALVRGLVERFEGRVPAAPTDPAAREDWMECRRHAARLLQRYVCEVLHRGQETPVPEVFSLKLFLGADERTHSIDDVVAAMAATEGLPLLFGHAFAELGALTRPVQHDGGLPSAIVASPWLHRCLARLGPVRGAFDFALLDADPTDAKGWIVCRELEAPGVRGVIGVPTDASGHPDIAVLLPEGDRARQLTALAVEHGCVGWVRLDASVEWDAERLADLEKQVLEACRACLDDLLGSLTAGKDIEQHDRCVRLLLDYASRHLTMIDAGDGPPRVRLSAPLVDRILALPVFASVHGATMGGWRVLRLFCARFEESAADAQARVFERLAVDLPPYLRSWVERTVHESRVVLKPVRRVGVGAHATVVEEPDTIVLKDSLVHWLHGLRGDAAAFPVFIWVHAEHAKRDELCVIDGENLFVSPNHPLVLHAIHDPSPEALAWLLLALFAHVNAELDEVENRHERTFQLEVARALAEGRLQYVTPV